MPEPEGRWGALAILSICLLLALTPWFSAAAVSPLIGAEWGIETLEIAMLTVAVQVGFAIGAFAIAFSGAADAMPSNRLIALGALLAAVANAAFVTITAMAMSGSSAVAAGLLFGAPAGLLVAVLATWGVSVVADSAQFSTAISELAPAGTAGSALALQTAAGFLLTSVTILGVGLLDPADRGGWAVAFGLLALGPVVGIAAMARLRGLPEALRMAGGRR